MLSMQKKKNITCLANSLHRADEEVQEHFPKVDVLITNIQNFFLKASSKV